MKFFAISSILSVLAYFAVADDALTFSMPGVKDPKAVVYANHEMGKYNLTSCSGAPSCGVAMSSYNGVSAKSNGQDQCTGECCGGSISTGCAYQCVELAQRYMNEKHGITPIWHDNANMMCDSYPSGISKTNDPQPGDLWVRTTGTYGHVAVITAVHSSTVDVIEQNSSPSGTNTYNKADAGCFLTAGHGSGSCPNLGKLLFPVTVFLCLSVHDEQLFCPYRLLLRQRRAGQGREQPVLLLWLRRHPVPAHGLLLHVRDHAERLGRQVPELRQLRQCQHGQLLWLGQDWWR
jgi:surface antigen